MLGLGHGINKSVIRKKYALDYIPGGVENNVLWLSYYQMTGRRNDECFRLRDLTTSDEWDIGRIDGYVDYNRVLNLLSGHTGLATKIYNNTFVVGTTDAIQTNVANMPIVAEGGSFHHDGFKFVGASSNYLSIVDYAGVQIVEPPLSIYIGFKSSSNNFIFGKGNSGNSTIQFSAYKSGSNLYLYLEGTSNNTAVGIAEIDKVLFNWQNKAANGLKAISLSATTEKTMNIILTNRPNFYIASRPIGSYFTGNIKTISVSADNLYDYYNIIAARC